MARKIKVTIDGHPDFVDYFDNFTLLQRAFGTKSKYERAGDGWVVYHPINPNKPLRAEWVDVDDKGDPNSDGLYVFGFNTGNHYTKEGQRISVGWKRDASEESEVFVLFHDHDRGIWGKLQAESVSGALNVFVNGSNEQRARLVYSLYLRNKYDNFHVDAHRINAGDWPLVKIF